MYGGKIAMGKGEGAYGYGGTWGHVNKMMDALWIKFGDVQLQWAVCQLLWKVELAKNQ